MFTSTQLTPSTGEAYIAVKRNRVKSYPTSLTGVNNSIYLSDKQEFEIELYNPSSTTKLAKISINGKPISSSGIVLKPGQRHYIERYIDAPRKFQFETYVVDTNPSTMAAIQQNGLVEISFHDEYVPPQYTPTVTYPDIRYDLSWKAQGGQNIGSNVNYLNAQSQNLLNRKSTSLDKMDFIGNVSSFCSTAGGASCDNSPTMEMFSEEKFRSASVKETGTVEQGGLSQQKFTNYSGSFNSWTTNIVTIKLLPYSEKPLEMAEIACYCVECGTKNKGNKFKFCPTCGHKF